MNDTATAKPYAERTVDDLRGELKARELPTSGTKDELVERLAEDDRLHDQAVADQVAADEAAAAEARPRVQSDCVVESDFHVGRAVNGLVCSYHAMHYAADGSPRG